jgi:methionyl-tRNA formyltransferase
MKIIVFAYQNWGVKAIKTILSMNHEIIQVITHPTDMDKNEKNWFESVKEECIKNQIKCLEKTNSDNEVIKLVKKENPDLIFSAGWRRLIPKEIFTIPKKGTINIHDALLPNYRGFAPINWAIINGEKEIGITSHFIDEQADTGGIILQNKINVEINDKASDVYQKNLELAPKLIEETITLVDKNNVKPIIQNRKDGFFCSRRFPEDGKIDWKKNREDIHNLIRALSDPYPNAFCYFEGKKILIKESTLSEEDFRGLSGKIIQISDKGIIVTCGENHKENQALLITKWEIENAEKSSIIKLWNQLE